MASGIIIQCPTLDETVRFARFFKRYVNGPFVVVKGQGSIKWDLIYIYIDIFFFGGGIKLDGCQMDDQKIEEFFPLKRYFPSN